MCGPRKGLSYPVGPMESEGGTGALPAWIRWGPGTLVAAAAVVVLIMAFGTRSGRGEAPPGPRATVPAGGDFIAFWVGGTILDEDGDAAQLYHRPRCLAELAQLFPEAPPRYRLAYPPPLYQACAMAQVVPYRWAAAGFVVAMAILLALGAWLLVDAIPALRAHRWTAWAIIWASPSAVLASLTGQFAGLWFVLLAGACWCWSRQRPLAAGLLLGALCAKPTLALPVFLGLVLAGQGWTLVGFALSGGLLLGASLVVGGIEPWARYMELMSGAGELTRRMWLLPERQLTLRTLAALPLRGTYAATWLGWLGSGCGLALCAWIAPAAWRGARHEETAMLARGAACSAALLAAPHLFDYDLGLHGLGLAAGAAVLLARPGARLGWILLAAAILGPLAYPVALGLRISLGTVALLAWTIWLGREVRAVTRPARGTT